MGMHETIKQEVERVGYHLISTKPTSNDNIKAVMAFSEIKKEYVTWIFNVSMGGLYNGHYFSYFIPNTEEEKERVRQLAYDDWDNRK